MKHEDFPKVKDLKAVIPKDCFVPETSKSLGYLAVSLIGTALCTSVGFAMLGRIGTGILTLPLWSAYAAVTGTVAMGLWVLAHECGKFIFEKNTSSIYSLLLNQNNKGTKYICLQQKCAVGHGAFSPNRRLTDIVGYVLHSLLLVPYFSWQRSHAVHHQYTNHMELGETHVPEVMHADDMSGKRFFSMDKLGEQIGMKVFGVYQAFIHLIVGWPAYLLIGATGGPDRGMTNHFYPEPLTTPPNPRKELFPGNWKAKVYQSDIGIAAMVTGLITWAVCDGIGPVMALYGGPYIVINAWLVLYTWLQHTDVDVPHFSDEDHNFVKGALHTIDRPYDKLDPFGFIDFLHHKIGSTHVAHHFDSTIPHYKAQIATDAIKKNFPEFYLYDPTPIPAAFWRVCKGCAVVEKRGDKWIWRNNGVVKAVEN